MQKWKWVMLRIKSFQTFLTVLMTLGYLLGTHLSTINSLKMALASKAEQAEIVLIDNKLTRIEVKLEEALITKQEFYQLRQYIDKSLIDLSIRINQANQGEPFDGR